MTGPYAIYSHKIFTETGWQKGYMVIEGGKIKEITESLSVEIKEVLDYTNKTIIPGLIDTHVHINEPGRTHWEGFETATKAAVKGGFTTIIDMPLNSNPVTVSSKNLEIKIEETKGKLYCQVGFHGGIVPDSIDEIENLNSSGIFGLKIFTIHSGIDEFGYITKDNLEEVMRKVSAVNGVLMVHAELEQPVVLGDDTRKYSTYLNSRPRSWENDAITLLIELMQLTGCRVHIIHLSSSDTIQSLKEAKAKGLPITIETCPHYLYFASEDIEDGQTQFKCAPPIREIENQEKLWEAVDDGIIDFISSDHSPSPPDLKERHSGDFMKAWGGISSLQFSFLAVLTQAAKYNISIDRIISLMSTQPAKFLGLSNKGQLKAGFDADFTILDEDQSTLVEETMIMHKHPLTPYLNEKFEYTIISTFVGGKEVYSAKPEKFTLVENPLIFKKKL